MKTNAIVRIVLFSIAILVLTGILLGGMALGSLAGNIDWDLDGLSFHFWDNDMISGGTVESAFTVDPTQVRNISIDWASGSVTIRPGEPGDNTIYVTEQGASEDNKLIWKQSGDTLTIQYSEVKVYFGLSFDGSKDLTITVPPEWECEDLEIDAASASVEVSDLTIREVDFDGASGTLRLENCCVDEIDLDTASGDINFSGTLNSLSCDAASADCRITVTNVPKRIDMDMASGDLELTLPESCGFTVEMDAMSADFHSDFAATKQNGQYVYGDGSCRICVSAMSGDVSILKAQPLPTAVEVFPVLYADSFTKDQILSPLQSSYQAGSLVTIQTNVLTDADLELYVNGEFICTQTEGTGNDGSNYWIFTFQMPQQAATIQFKTSDET